MADGRQHDDPPQLMPVAMKERVWGSIIFFQPMAVDGKHFSVSFDRYFSAE